MKSAALACALVAACASHEPPTVTVAPLPTPSGEPAPVAERPAPPKGDAAPEILVPGKITIVHFFASWCAPCRKSLPELDAIASRHKSGVAVVGIGEDDEVADIHAFVARLGIHFATLEDVDRKHAGTWKPATMPATFVVDRRGALRFTHAGYHDDDALTLEREVTALAAER